MPAQPLQMRLIKSLNDLSEHSNSIYRERLTAIIQDLNKSNVRIPNNDYSNVIKFVLVLMQSMPDLFTNNANDQALRELCTTCMQRINLHDELQAKSRKSSR
jgi:hypothetical protein